MRTDEPARFEPAHGFLRPEPPKARWTESVWAGLLSCGVLVAWSAIAGQDANWDLRNYHYWTGYALLEGRHFFDIAPAQIQTWLNPLLHTVHYLLLRHLHPVAVKVTLGILAGINGMLLYAIARRLIIAERWLAVLFASLIASIGLSAPVFLSQVGTSFLDAYLPALVLGALLVVSRDQSADARRGSGRRPYLTAGLLLGMATGFKLTYALYAVALMLAFLLSWRALPVGWYRLGCYMIGGVLGAALSGGYWAFKLWSEYGSPVFPFLNAVFRSPFYPAVNFHDRRFIPGSIAEAVTYPFRWIIGQHPSAELPFRDARFALISVLLPIIVLRVVADRIDARAPGARRARTFQPDASDTRWCLLGLFFVASYAVWLAHYAIHRYAAPLELLSGLILFLCVDRLLHRTTLKIGVFVAMALFVVAWTRPANWGRAPDSDDWWDVRLDEGVVRPNTLVFIVSGGDPVSYVLPSFPDTARVVRLTGNLPLNEDMLLWKQAKAIVDAHPGPIRTLTRGRVPSELERGALSRFGLELGPIECDSFSSKLERFVLCPVRRRGSTGNPGVPALPPEPPAGFGRREELRRPGHESSES